MTTLTTTMRGAGYIRVSDEKGRSGKENFFSPIEQRDTINRFAQARPDVEIVEWIEAIDVSSKGGNNFQQADFQAMVERIKAGDLDAVIVPRFDRFGRDLKESLAMIGVIEKAGGHVISASETTTDDSAGRLARNAFLMFANYQLDRITENWQKVHAHKLTQGVLHGPKTPLGYERGDGRKLVSHPVHGPLVSWVFEQVASGRPKNQVLCEAQERGLPIKGASTLFKMLQNRTYLGEVRCGDRPVIKGAHVPLVSVTTFAACQVQRGKRHPRRDYLLTGLVRCTGCGRVMTFGHASWTCQQRYGLDKCPASASISDAVLLPYVESRLWDAKLENERFIATQITPDLLDLEAAVVVAQDDVRAWMQNTVAQRADLGLWTEELDRRNHVKVEQERGLRKAQEKAGLGQLPQDVSLHDLYESGDTEMRRTILRASIESVLVTTSRRRKVPVEERVEITWRW